MYHLKLYTNEEIIEQDYNTKDEVVNEFEAIRARLRKEHPNSTYSQNTTSVFRYDDAFDPDGHGVLLWYDDDENQRAPTVYMVIYRSFCMRFITNAPYDMVQLVTNGQYTIEWLAEQGFFAEPLPLYAEN